LAGRQRKAELAELRRARQEREAEAAAAAAAAAAATAAKRAVEAAAADELRRKRARLNSGFAAAFNSAAAVEAEERGRGPAGGGGAEGAASASEADAAEAAAEVRRVLAARNDYEALGLLGAGATAVALRRSYRRLSRLVHPDKCAAQGAQVRDRAAYARRLPPPAAAAPIETLLYRSRMLPGPLLLRLLPGPLLLRLLPAALRTHAQAALRLLSPAPTPPQPRRQAAFQRINAAYNNLSKLLA
jgi:hypothetical protein